MRARSPWPLPVVLLAAALMAPAFAAQVPEMPVETYLTFEEALALIFDEGERLEATEIRFTGREKRSIEEAVGRRLFEDGFHVHRGVDDEGRVTGYAIVTEEIGKYQPITFIVGVSPEGEVIDVAVMVYRESHGADVKRRRFLAQFAGKSTDDPIRMNRDIINISGATLSVRAISRGVRKVLHTVDRIFLGASRRDDIEWRAMRVEKDGDEHDEDGDDDAAADDDTGALPESRRSKHVRYRMGTVLEIVAYGEPGQVEPALGAAFAEVARLEALFTTYRDDSELARVNRHASSAPVRVSEDTLRCVARALAVARASDGAFDPTLRPHGHRAVIVDARAGTIRFLRPDIALDLGAIGKGYALDAAARVLEERGVSRALLNFGGQILALDPPPGATAWGVVVRDPRAPDEALAACALVRGSVSTSARYERGAHIVDPRNGASVGDVLSVSVRAPTATAADAWSTAIAVAGTDGVARWLEGAAGAALVVTARETTPRLFASTGTESFRLLAAVGAGSE